MLDKPEELGAFPKSGTRIALAARRGCGSGVVGPAHAQFFNKFSVAEPIAAASSSHTRRLLVWLLRPWANCGGFCQFCRSLFCGAAGLGNTILSVSAQAPHPRWERRRQTPHRARGFFKSRPPHRKREPYRSAAFWCSATPWRTGSPMSSKRRCRPALNWGGPANQDRTPLSSIKPQGDPADWAAPPKAFLLPRNGLPLLSWARADDRVATASRRPISRPNRRQKRQEYANANRRQALRRKIRRQARWRRKALQGGGPKLSPRRIPADTLRDPRRPSPGKSTQRRGASMSCRRGTSWGRSLRKDRRDGRRLENPGRTRLWFVLPVIAAPGDRRRAFFEFAL